jgi:hypothetical protein
MLFLTYWELNEDMSIEEQQGVAQKLVSSGLFPPKGVNIIRWDATPDGWGILIAEADSAADIAQSINMWRAAGTGFFKTTRTSPAQPVQEAMAGTDELLKALGLA